MLIIMSLSFQHKLHLASGLAQQKWPFLRSIILPTHRNVATVLRHITLHYRKSKESLLSSPGWSGSQLLLANIAAARSKQQPEPLCCFP